MSVWVDGPGTVKFDIPSRIFRVMLFVTFGFKHFLTLALCHNPHTIKLIPLEFLCK